MIPFPKLQQAFHTYDAEREKLINQSRVVLKLSKQLIYALHRSDPAETLLKQINDERKKLDKIATHSHKMLAEGSYKVALQEYAEAALYYYFVKNGQLKELDLPPELFILGLCDLPGELNRRAVYLAGKGEVAKVQQIRDAVDHIYGELLKFDFRDNEIRRKVDAVKYELRKLEDLLLDMHLKGRR